MYSYKDQLEILSPIRLREGESIRVDCPFCGGRNTFGISNKDGKRIWHCFKASCGIRGSEGVGMETTSVLKRIHSTHESLPEKPKLPIPIHLSDPSNHPAVIQYLEDNNCIHALENNFIRIMYAPTDKRVLFFNPDSSGAVGRSLVGAKPKWKRYGSIEGVMAVGKGDTAVVVEDIASACAVSQLNKFKGCALLGTTLSNVQKAQLITFREVVIALDKDASATAINMQRKLEGRVNTSTIFLEEDLKCLSHSRLCDLFQIKQF